jgi:tripartite-type tricarboxylate transporter receptor subunit TctC
MRKFLLSALLFISAVTHAAAEYPDRTIRLLVPYPPGGPNDTIARMIGSKLADSFKQQVVIENKPGAAGNIAMELTARAAPDGYTAVVPSVSYVTNPTLFKKINYNLNDVRPISLLAKGPTLLVASPSLGVKSVAELIALAKQKPGTIDYGSGGIGSTSHLSGEMLRHLGGIDIQHIPYKGTNDLISDLLAGRVPLYFMSPLVARQHVKDGKLIALGMTSAKRVAGWTDVPTMAETLPGFVVETWHPLVVPATTPQPVVDKLSKAAGDAIRSKEVSDKLLSLGFEPVGSKPDEAAAYIKAETQRWLEIIQKANVKQIE